MTDLVALLEQRADAIALRVGGHDFTWSAVGAAADRLAAAADSTAGRPAARLALSTSEPLVAAAALVAALRSGRTLILLHPRLTAAERGTLALRAAADLLVTDEGLGCDDALSHLVLSPAHLTAGPVPPLRRAPSGEPLLLLFTSGTTGPPKGAMLSAEALAAAAAASSERLATGPDDRWLACMPLSHIGGISILVRALHDGFVVVAQSGFRAPAVAAALHDERITRLSLVPTMLRDLLDAGAMPPSTLRTLLLGGAAAPPGLVREAVTGGWPVATTYGLTEAAAQVTTATPQETEADPQSSGHPLPGYRLRISEPDADGIGQVEVAAPSLMVGYRGDDEATRAAVRDGWLRTGDLGSLLPDGQLCLVARRTDLIVSGGENIYPAEVEAAVRDAFPHLHDLCVVGLASERWGQEVALLLVAGTEQPPALAALRSALTGRLAAFKMPRHLRQVAALPRTPAGKLDRVAAAAAFDGRPPQT